MTVGRPSSVLFLATVAATMGVHLLPHADKLRALGWRVEFAAGGPPTEVLRNSDYPYHELVSSRAPWEVRSHVKFAIQARELALRNEYEVVYVHSPIAAALARAALRTVPSSRRPAIVYFAHGFHFLGPADRSFVQWGWYIVERLLSRATDHLIVLNQTDFDSVRRWKIAREGRVTHVLGVGVDADRYALAPEKDSSVLGPGRWIVSVAELTPNKQPSLLVEALGLLDGDVSLAFAGVGSEARRIAVAAEQLGLMRRVRLLGYVDDVPNLLRSADVVALVSGREGLPRSLMEALCVGRPVAVTPTRGSVDVARAAGCPVSQDFTPESIAQALGRALGDERSPEQVRERFLSNWGPGLQQAVSERVAQVVADAATDRAKG